MRFKEFITRYRIGIVLIGLMLSAIAVEVARIAHYEKLTGTLFTDLAASALTVVFTALVIDYLNEREQHQKTKDVAGLAEDAFAAICFRINWETAKLYGLKNPEIPNTKISTRDEARDSINELRKNIEQHLTDIDFLNTKTSIHTDYITEYFTKLQQYQGELEQTLTLYEYALKLSLRKCVLHLRNELEMADSITRMIDIEKKLNRPNESLVRDVAKNIHAAVYDVLEHESKSHEGKAIHSKASSTK